MAKRNTPGTHGNQGVKKRQHSHPQFTLPLAKPPLHPAVVWSRSVSMASICFGGLGFLTVHFWWAVGLVYIGVLLLSLDLYLEPWFKEHAWFRVVGLSGLLVVLSAFSFGVAFAAEPLHIMAQLRPDEYAPDTVIGGIPWRSQFADVRLVVRNSSAHDYENLDLQVWVDNQSDDFMIYRVGQTSIFPVVSISPYNPYNFHLLLNPPKSRRYEILTGNSELSSSSYNIHCDRLAPEAYFETVLAIARFTFGIRSKEHGDSAPIFGPRPRLTSLRVAGRFRGTFRIRDFDKKLPVVSFP